MNSGQTERELTAIGARGARSPEVPARYCSGRCRQRALRARAEQDALLRQLEEAKRHYWALVRRYAEALGADESRVLEVEAQFVDEAGNVWIRGEFAGHAAPAADGRARWGLEAAGPPWSPPTDWIHEHFGPERVASDPAYRAQLQAIGRALAAARPMPDGSPAAPLAARLAAREFPTVTADPPWQYDNRASRGAAEDHYPVMGTEELAGLMDRLGRDGS